MLDRSLIHHDISKLEQAVDENPYTKSFLQLVLHELKYRKSKKRTIALIARVEQLITQPEDAALEVNLPKDWVNHDTLDSSIPPDFDQVSAVVIRIPSETNIMVAAAIKLLSLVNILASKGTSITLEFEGRGNKSMGYLHRMGFFQNLLETISVIPKLSSLNEPSEHYGKNCGLVEFEKVKVGELDDNLPARLAQTITQNSVVEEGIRKRLRTAIETLFSELTDNINLHSRATLPAFATCQIYKPGGRAIAQVSVCDSGEGILNTLRPALSEHYPESPEYTSLSDDELGLEMFKNGLSRRGDPQGCGLTSCARQALKFNASVHIRTNQSRIELLPNDNGIYTISPESKTSALPHVQGTHITFEFPLYKLSAS